MKYKTLIYQSLEFAKQYPDCLENSFSFNVFEQGAYWMFVQLKRLSKQETLVFNKTINYTFYGIIKYLVCILVSLTTAILLYKINCLLCILSIFVFYFIEVHYLFLFPLLIINNKNSIINSIRITYQIGVFKAVLVVLPIGFYMLIGLLNFKQPLKHWYIGCLAILIWFENDVRNRL